jgi:site-specific DNA recombinase
VPCLDGWLSQALAPHRLADTIEQMYQAQPTDDSDQRRQDAENEITELGAKLNRYRQALDAGADPAVVTAWIAETQARRIEVQQQLRAITGRTRMTKDEIRAVAEAISSARAVLQNADPTDKAAVYAELGLKLTYQPAKQTIRAEANLDPDRWAYGACPRGDLNPHALRGH